MGRYIGSYQSISGEYIATDLTTSYITLNPFIRRVATFEQDLLLPPTFTAYVTQGDYGCPLSLHNSRTARLFTSTVAYLEVPIPWNEGSVPFIAFFEELKEKNEIVNVRYLGETINDNSLIWLVNQV